MGLFRSDPDRDRVERVLGEMGVVGDRCDRCGAGGRIRVGKDIVVNLPEPAGPDAPLHVDTKRFDLVFCAHDFAVNEPTLRQQRWITLDDRR